MKKIIFCLIFFFIYINFSFATTTKNTTNNTNHKCLVMIGKESREESEIYQNCEKWEKIYEKREYEDWSFAYISYIENEYEEKWKIKINSNWKIIFEKEYKNPSNIYLGFSLDFVLSKYKNHSLTRIEIDEYLPYSDEPLVNNKPLFSSEINWIYLDGKKISGDTKNKDIFLNFAWFFGFPMEIKYSEEKWYWNEIEKRFTLFVDWKFYTSTTFWNSELFSKLWEYLENKSFLEENKEYFLDKDYREKIDKVLNNFFQDKENIWKIDIMLKNLKEKQDAFAFWSKWYEIYEYIKNELKIFQTKNS